jgi:hypothetical protein
MSNEIRQAKRITLQIAGITCASCVEHEPKITPISGTKKSRTRGRVQGSRAC